MTQTWQAILLDKLRVGCSCFYSYLRSGEDGMNTRIRDDELSIATKMNKLPLTVELSLQCLVWYLHEVSLVRYSRAFGFQYSYGSS